MFSYAANCKEVMRVANIARVASISRVFSSSLSPSNSANPHRGSFVIQSFNTISPIGLEKFPRESYTVSGKPDTSNPHAIILRSHALQEDQIPNSVRCIARCGSGVNNIPVPRMTVKGIPIFNTPGANSNAVKELAICGILLASRRIVDGINHMVDLGDKGLARERVEVDKAMFKGCEIKGKTLGIVGLGHIGSSIAHDATALGMKVIGHDSRLSLSSAIKLPSETELFDNVEHIFKHADYISLNIPYINKPVHEGGTHNMISHELLRMMKPNTTILNMARGELVDSKALRDVFDSGGTGKYVTDFPDDLLYNHPNAIILPHLGASTAEAEDMAATMAVDTVKLFLETGTIVNSVNFPETILCPRGDNVVRIVVVNVNKSSVTEYIADLVANSNLNLLQQVSNSRDMIAYNVFDVECGTIETEKDGDVLTELQKQITTADGVISIRFISNHHYGHLMDTA